MIGAVYERYSTSSAPKLYGVRNQPLFALSTEPPISSLFNAIDDILYPMAVPASKCSAHLKLPCTNEAATAADGSWIEQASPGFAPDPTVTTGLAMLCFLGAGYDHMTPNKLIHCDGGLEWLIDIQNRSGQLGRSTGDHAIATMALAEAYGMTNDPGCGSQPRAVDLLLSWQVMSEPRGGWPIFPLTDEPSSGEDDSQQTIDIQSTMWATMALKSAKAGGLNVSHDSAEPGGLEGVHVWLHQVLSQHQQTTISDGIPAILPTEHGPQHPQTDATAFLGMIAVFIGLREGDPNLDPLVQRLLSTRIHAFATNQPIYPLIDYPTTIVAFQHGAITWQQVIRHQNVLTSHANMPSQSSELGVGYFSDGTASGTSTNLMLMTMISQIF